MKDQLLARRPFSYLIFSVVLPLLLPVPREDIGQRILENMSIVVQKTLLILRVGPFDY